MSLRKTRFELVVIVLTIMIFSCATIPTVKHEEHEFPKEAYLGKPPKKMGKYKVLGVVRSRVGFPTLDPQAEFDDLCKNYYRRAAGKLVEYAKKKKGDAVIRVRSVVKLLSGKWEEHKTAECVDDGSMGQVLTRGIAIRWIPKEKQD